MANKINYTGDGETTTYYFNFPFFSQNDIHVTINNVAATAGTYTLHPTASPDDADTQYTGGDIEFTTAPAIGATISIYRDVELARHIDYQPTLQPQSYQLNQDLNQCMAILQEQAEKITNTLGLAAIPTLADLLTELTYIREHIGDCLTEEDLSPLETTIENIESAITTLQGYDYVIESQLPTADNNYTWYRKYKSGWIEQGGYVSDNSGDGIKVDLVVTMQDANYQIMLTGFLHSATAGNTTCVSDYQGAISTTSFYVNNYVENGSTRGNGTGFWWTVSGIAQ